MEIEAELASNLSRIQRQMISLMANFGHQDCLIKKVNKISRFPPFFLLEIQVVFPIFLRFFFLDFLKIFPRILDVFYSEFVNNFFLAFYNFSFLGFIDDFFSWDFLMIFCFPWIFEDFCFPGLFKDLFSPEFSIISPYFFRIV